MSSRQCALCNEPLEVILDEVFDTRFGITNLYSISKCQGCGIEQTSPLPDQRGLNALYEQYYNFSGEKNSRYTRLRAKFINSWLYRTWLTVDGDISFHQKCGSGRLLDVGCNEGRGLDFYQKHGFLAEGLELNSKAADIARGRGFTVYGTTLEGFESDIKYDVIVLSNVLEHSLNPSEMLQYIHRLLNAQGQLWVSCPNSRSWLRSIFGRYWINWHVPFHVVHFSPETLSNTLKDAQFEVEAIRQETPALWVAHTVLARLFARLGQSTKQLRSAPLVASMILIIRGLFFPFLWLGNLSKRGDCLVVVARKS